MASIAPAPISSTFISMDEFDDHFPDPKASSPSVITPPQNAGQSSPTASIIHGSSETASFSEGPETANWVGRLMEYAAQKGATPPAFTDKPQSGFEPRFVVLVKIDERDEPFGDGFQTFGRKKQAKQYACMLALEWLGQNGYINEASAPRRLSATTSAASGSTAARSIAVMDEPSVASRVPIKCHRLGITQPTYVMSSDPAAPMMWSGHALFPLEAKIPGKVGEFRNVFGKKNAREVCAMNVLAFLEEFKRGHPGAVGRV